MGAVGRGMTDTGIPVCPARRMVPVGQGWGGGWIPQTKSRTAAGLGTLIAGADAPMWGGGRLLRLTNTRLVLDDDHDVRRRCRGGYAWNSGIGWSFLRSPPLCRERDLADGRLPSDPPCDRGPQGRQQDAPSGGELLGSRPGPRSHDSHTRDSCRPDDDPREKVPYGPCGAEFANGTVESTSILSRGLAIHGDHRSGLA